MIDLWKEFRTKTGTCFLCADTGDIDTCGLVSPARAACGVQAPCFCPASKRDPDIDLESLWLALMHPEHKLCGLCGNFGILTVQEDSRPPIRRFCICPNGRALKEAGAAIWGWPASLFIFRPGAARP